MINKKTNVNCPFHKMEKVTDIKEYDILMCSHCGKTSLPHNKNESKLYLKAGLTLGFIIFLIFIASFLFLLIN